MPRNLHPAINRWAIVRRPYGARTQSQSSASRKVENLEASGFYTLESATLMSIRNFLMFRLFWSNIVPDIGSAHPEDYVFRDVCGVIADSFEVVGHP